MQPTRQLKQGNTPVTTAQDATPTPFVSGSNPLLVPEASTSKTLGLVWSPTFLSNFNVALDWWKIRIDNTIVGDSPNQILKDCYEQGIESRCSRFTRDPSNGIVTGLKFGNRNAGFAETEGYDLDVSYRVDTGYGKLSAGWTSTYVSKNVYRSTNDVRDAITPINGASPPSAPLPALRSACARTWCWAGMWVTSASAGPHATTGVKALPQRLAVCRRMPTFRPPVAEVADRLQRAGRGDLPRRAVPLQPAVGCNRVGGVPTMCSARKRR